jgi:hypothetical protein
MYTVTNYGERKRMGISQLTERLRVLKKDSGAGLCFVSHCATFATLIRDVGFETGCTY